MTDVNYLGAWCSLLFTFIVIWWFSIAWIQFRYHQTEATVRLQVYFNNSYIIHDKYHLFNTIYSVSFIQFHLFNIIFTFIRY